MYTATFVKTTTIVIAHTVPRVDNSQFYYQTGDNSQFYYQTGNTNDTKNRSYDTYPKTTLEATLHDRYKLLCRQMPITVHIKYGVNSIYYRKGNIFTSTDSHSSTKLSCKQI